MPNGYVLHETNEVAVIATLESDNAKTGNMVQIWILVRHESPVQAVKNGHDSANCFDCKMRGTDGFKERKCYVNVGQGPNAVWRSYDSGRYPYLPIEQYGAVFAKRAVRFGAYGEPVLIPLVNMAAIVAVASGHTGYTHQWRRPEFQGYRQYLMASCDSWLERIHAKQMEWRTFRVRRQDEILYSNEIACPASEEMGKRTKCLRCKLCNGSNGSSDPRKDIAIIVHGSGAKNFVSLNSLTTAP